MIQDAEEIVTLWRSGARAYICGTRNFSDGVRDAAKKIAFMVRDREQLTDDDSKELEDRFKEALHGRVASDVFD